MHAAVRKRSSIVEAPIGTASDPTSSEEYRSMTAMERDALRLLFARSETHAASVAMSGTAALQTHKVMP
jgi:hypothetical protein